jgi:phage terminase small subunit
MEAGELMITPKKRVFVREYLKDLNATQAAIRTGYSEKSARKQGNRLTTDADVAALIKAAMDKRAAESELSAKYVIDVIRETVDRCRQATPVKDKKGNQVFVETPLGDTAAAYTFESAAVLKGSELLGKHLGIFTDKLEVTGNVALAERLKAARERTSK